MHPILGEIQNRERLLLSESAMKSGKFLMGMDEGGHNASAYMNVFETTIYGRGALYLFISQRFTRTALREER